MAGHVFTDSTGTYSERVKCPDCASRVRLEDVDLVHWFRCRNCGNPICVSKWYRRGMQWASLAIGLILVFVLGLKGWWAYLLWVPLSLLSLVPMTFVVRVLVPPTLERHVSKYSGPLGLGGG